MVASRPVKFGQLYLDLDGVLADFDDLAGRLLGTDNIYKWEFVHGPEAFWKRLSVHPNFFSSLAPKADAYHLFGAVSHLNPIILTALPRSGAFEVDRQKREWVARHLGPRVEVITCVTKDKPRFCKPGDILVDDRAVNRGLWRDAGGHFVLHTSAAETVAHLERIDLI